MTVKIVTAAIKLLWSKWSLFSKEEYLYSTLIPEISVTTQTWYIILMSLKKIQYCAKLLKQYVIETLFQALKISVGKNHALWMSKRHVCTNIAWRGREDACLEHENWIRCIILFKYIIVHINILLIGGACVPTSFTQDCSRGNNGEIKWLSI